MHPVVGIDGLPVGAGAAHHHVLCIDVTEGDGPGAGYWRFIESDGDLPARLTRCDSDGEICLPDGAAEVLAEGCARCQCRTTRNGHARIR